jgi:hypothetical protein
MADAVSAKLLVAKGCDILGVSGLEAALYLSGRGTRRFRTVKPRFSNSWHRFVLRLKADGLRGF